MVVVGTLPMAGGMAVDVKGLCLCLCRSHLYFTGKPQADMTSIGARIGARTAKRGLPDKSVTFVSEEGI